MTAPPISAANRYLPSGSTRVYWVVSIADAEDPSRTELDAGWDLSGEIAEMDGWAGESNVVGVSPLHSEWDTEHAARLAVTGAMLRLYADRAGDDIRALLSRHADGFIVFLHGGDTPGHVMDVWPVEVASLSQATTVGNDPSTVTVQFAMNATPAPGITVP